MKTPKIPLVGILATALMGLATESRATTITFNFDTSFGAVPSDGTSPWLTAVFDDVGSGKVRLTLSAGGLSTDDGGTGATPEYADEWWFNLDPTLDATALAFSLYSGVAYSSIDQANDGHKADGDGYFDFHVNFLAKSLAYGETSVIDISGIAGLTANDFNFSSVPSGGAGTYSAAAHIQSTGAGNLGSDFVGANFVPTPVPEPATLALLGLGLLGLAARMRRRHS